MRVRIFKLRSELLRIVMSVGQSVGRSVCGKNQDAKFQLAIYRKYLGDHWRTSVHKFFRLSTLNVSSRTENQPDR